jgi:multimeric flavodoxin WrbA
MVKVIGFSGSPIFGGNIEKGLRAVLEATKLDYEFIRLYDLDMKVCVGCKMCADTNRCAFDDDINPILDKIEAADALVFSAYPSFGSVNALTKVFIERNWPLRHNHILTKGKVGAAVVCGGGGLFELEDYFERYFVGYLMTNFQGVLKLNGNVPCMSCGYGEDCEGSGFLKRFGPGAKITPDKFSDFATDQEALERAKALGEAIARAISDKVSS